jgi:hypothetical protein
MVSGNPGWAFTLSNRTVLNSGTRLDYSALATVVGYGMETPVGSGAEASLTRSLVTTVSPEVTEV